jgi:hypothetical protein
MPGGVDVDQRQRPCYINTLAVATGERDRGLGRALVLRAAATSPLRCLIRPSGLGSPCPERARSPRHPSAAARPTHRLLPTSARSSTITVLTTSSIVMLCLSAIVAQRAVHVLALHAEANLQDVRPAALTEARSS